jgi:hypothetical protein
MRFGIGMNTDHTLEEVGQQFSVTRERIRQIEAKALRKLKHPSTRVRMPGDKSFRSPWLTPPEVIAIVAPANGQRLQIQRFDEPSRADHGATSGIVSEESASRKVGLDPADANIVPLYIVPGPQRLPSRRST